MQEIVFVTHNRGKVFSAQKYFDGIRLVTFDYEPSALGRSQGHRYRQSAAGVRAGGQALLCAGNRLLYRRTHFRR